MTRWGEGDSDVSEHDEAFDGEADDDPAERLRQAWRDMKAGRVMTREELRRRGLKRPG
ncbi:MAG: hypothetical protein JNL42_08290 [Anaerolineae bacterium]|nr:hypothetical protein [Anaerolineae bacterium]